jgi:hypothetical protein
MPMGEAAARRTSTDATPVVVAHRATTGDDARRCVRIRTRVVVVVVVDDDVIDVIVVRIVRAAE